MIYFIQSGNSAVVKIGFALNPQLRLRQLQCGNPETLTLLAIRDGNLEDEAFWHSKFTHLRIRGEWFKWCDEIREYAMPLLADPERALKRRADYARALIATGSPKQAYERLMGKGWSDARRAAFVERVKAKAEIERLRSEP